jgi:protein TonB
MQGEHEARTRPMPAVRPAAGTATEHANTGRMTTELIAGNVNMPAALPRVTRSEMHGLAAAVLAHACLLAPFLLPDGRIGAGGFDTDAIGVEIVTVGPALEARNGVRGREGAAAQQAVRETDGEPRPMPEEAASRDSRREESMAPAMPTPAPADLVLPDWRVPDRPPDADATEPLIAPVSSTGTQPEAQTPIRPTIADDPAAQTASIPGVQIVARDLGGAAARGRDALDPGAAAMAAARIGRRDAYGMAVRAAVAESVELPGEPGEVKVEFGIGLSGRVEKVRVVKSSGSVRVDQAAVSAARRARIPPRPPELAGQSLVYDVTLTFITGQ